MNLTLVLYLIGQVLRYEGMLMLIPLWIAILNRGPDQGLFVASIVVTELASFLLCRLKPKNKHFQARDGLMAVALSWILLSAFGALPYYFSGAFGGYINCFFEAISGFTTTGATILTEIEALPRGVLFWRSETHWIGGMGVLVFVLAMMPTMHASVVQLFRAESPGPNPGKFVPKIRETAMIMYCIYFGLTAILTIALLFCGLPLYDALIHAMGAAGTGGFSNRNLSVGAYNNLPAEASITLFCFLFGVNFNVYYFMLRKEWKQALHNEELWLYTAIVVIVALLITGNIADTYGGSLFEAFRHAAFQTVTIITTTGYSTADFELWPVFSKSVLVLLMFVGACAGSTGGGLKVTRIHILFKTVAREVNLILHPRMVRTVKTEGSTVDEGTIHGIMIFIAVYVLIIVIGTTLVSLDNKDLVTGATAVISATGNIGPGLSMVGPMGNYNAFSGFSKLVLSFCMLAGRLELFPMLLLFSPSAWKRT